MCQKFRTTSDIVDYFFPEIDNSMRINHGIISQRDDRNIILKALPDVNHKVEGITITIVDKNNGQKITQEFFPFENYVVMGKEHQNIKKLTHIFKPNGSFEWYGNDPTEKSVQTMRDEMTGYIAMWFDN